MKVSINRPSNLHFQDAKVGTLFEYTNMIMIKVEGSLALVIAHGPDLNSTAAIKPGNTTSFYPDTVINPVTSATFSTVP